MLKGFVQFVSGAAVLAITFLLPSNASAQICQFTSFLDTANEQLSTSPPPNGSYGTVCVNLVANDTATITFTASDGLIGSVAALALNVNTTLPFATAAAAITFPGHNAPSLTIGPPPGSPHVDGQGQFNLFVTNNDGYTDAFRLATTTVNLTTGSFAHPASVLVENSSGIDAPAHIFLCADADCSAGGGAFLTGFAGEMGTMPEPTSVALLGGIVLFVMSRLRKRLGRSGRR
jgi:hypothetical protein